MKKLYEIIGYIALVVKKLILGIVIAFLVFWVASLLKCEYFTFRYGHHFNEIYRENTMMGEIDYLKVLEYSDEYAKVYYVSKDRSGGDVLVFAKENNEWKYTEWWDTVWSRVGSADDFIWPYIR